MSQYIIQTRDLTKTYGEQKSVSNLNMHVRKGKIYGLLGRNGTWSNCKLHGSSCSTAELYWLKNRIYRSPPGKKEVDEISWAGY